MLLLVLIFKIHSFLALLITSIVVGLLSGINPITLIATMQEGMGSTLGFIGLVVGLGAIFGGILEHSGGAESLATFLLSKFGNKRASWALMLTGFIIAIPVFFDVAFIILVPIVYAIQRKTGKSLLLYGISLLAGLAITHSFVPPTPGPVAVAEIINVDLGWVILFGCLAGIPAAIICGPIFASFIAKRIHIEAPKLEDESNYNSKNFPAVELIILIIAVPILLIVFNTILNSSLIGEKVISKNVLEWIGMIGHPFSALLIVNIIAWYVLGVRRGFSKEELSNISTKSISSTGIILLLTGAGGVFKQVLIDTGAGEVLANYFAEKEIGILLVSFLAASLIRIIQGSATVAMITAAGITSALLPEVISEPQKALVVISIASGATIMSHVNDSGFWLVSKYLGLSETNTFKSWTIMTTLLAIFGFISVTLLSLLL